MLACCCSNRPLTASHTIPAAVAEAAEQLLLLPVCGPEQLSLCVLQLSLCVHVRVAVKCVFLYSCVILQSSR